MQETYRIANAEHNAGCECVQFVHTVNHFSLEILGKVFLLSFRFGRLIQFLHEIEVLHLRSLHTA